MASAGSRSPIASTSTSGIGDRVSAKCAVSGRPVRKKTSSARTSRFRSRGWIRSADSGSTLRSIRCRNVTSRRSAIDSSRRRSAASRAGTRKQPARQRAEVEAGAADQNRQPPARLDVADRGRGIARVLRGRVVVGRIGDVDQVVRDAAPIADRDLVGADVEAAIDGGRVAVDDLAAVALGDRQRQRALPGRGRAEHGDDERLHRTRTTT